MAYIDGSELSDTGGFWLPKFNDFIPFLAHHYNPAIVGSVGECLSPPYDIVSTGDQSRLYAQNEYNVIRLILGKDTPEDSEENNPYTRAKQHLSDWLKQKAVIPDRKRSFWLYSMSYEHEGLKKQQTGLIGLVKVREYEEGLILPHERVIEKPMEDRIKLIGTLSAQCETIWGLYQDKRDDMQEVFDTTRAQEPALNWSEDREGIQHCLWRIESEDLCRSIQNTIKKQVIFIADGHHRYQTMLRLRSRSEFTAPSGTGKSPWDYIMMYLSNVETDAPSVLPYHRIVSNLPDRVWNDFLSKVDNHFEVKLCTSQAAMLRELKAAAGSRSSIGCVLKGREPFYLLDLKNRSSYLSSLSSHFSGNWHMLDMNILNSLVLGGCFGQSEDRLEQQGQIEYSHHTEGPITDVRSGKKQAAFLLNAPRTSTIMDIARSGEIMPWKSTFFYPKPLSGLVFYLMGEHTI